jgi:hypothetical protein
MVQRPLKNNDAPGQNICIDPRAEMVIVRNASHPVSANIANDVPTLPAHHAMALALLA